jgi:putative transposase
MPRTARASVGGTWYHALNRGNRREAVFHKPADYGAFVRAMRDAHARRPVDLLGYCLMPNHFHLLLRPRRDGDRGRWIQWLLNRPSPPLPSPLRLHGACLAGAVQGLPGAG